MSEQTPAHTKPESVGRYLVGEKIAAGGMAAVYLARQGPVGNRFVALKVLHDELSEDPAFVEMFQDEARLMGKLAHPNTIQLYETGEADGRHYIAMELLIGESLLRVWRGFQAKNLRLPCNVIAWIGARVADGLHHAHELADASGRLENVVHRDVNPSNIFVTFDGRVKIIDFGLARSDTRVSKTANGVVKGKVAYLSPEVIDGAAPDRRADVFALGTSLWEMSVDRRLFKHENDVETVRAIHNAKIPDPRTLIQGYPDALWAVLSRALERDVARRYATAAEMSRELDACVEVNGRTVNNTSVAAMMAQFSA